MITTLPTHVYMLPDVMRCDVTCCQIYTVHDIISLNPLLCVCSEGSVCFCIATDIDHKFGQTLSKNFKIPLQRARITAIDVFLFSIIRHISRCKEVG